MSTSQFKKPPSQMTRAHFIKTFGSVYEHSPWIAEATFDDGLSEDLNRVGGLSSALAAVVDRASKTRQLALLRAHPDLAGKLALSGELTKASQDEQAGAGLDQCTAEEFARFQELNSAYKERFGFPFIIAVKGHSRASILAAFEARSQNDATAEFQEALQQVHTIARFRLESLAENGAPGASITGKVS